MSFFMTRRGGLLPNRDSFPATQTEPFVPIIHDFNHNNKRNSGQKIPDPSEETEMRAGGHSSGNYRNPCLTMHQPWASLLVYGIKRIEGRSWPAPIRGLYLVISDFNSKFRYPFGLISCSWLAVEVLGLRIREWNFSVLELLVLWYCYLGTEQG